MMFMMLIKDLAYDMNYIDYMENFIQGCGTSRLRLHAEKHHEHYTFSIRVSLLLVKQLWVILLTWAR